MTEAAEEDSHEDEESLEDDPDEGEGVDEEFQYDSEFDFEDWQDIPEEEASKILRGLEALIPDIVKRTMGNVIAGDDGIRAFVGDKNIPKELAGFLLGQVDATRRGILRIISREVRVFLEDMDFGGEIAKILTTLSFEIRTEIRFVPNEDRVKPSVKNSVRVRKKPDDETDEETGEEPPVDTDDAPTEEKKPASRWTRRKRADD